MWWDATKMALAMMEGRGAADVVGSMKMALVMMEGRGAAGVVGCHEDGPGHDGGERCPWQAQACAPGWAVVGGGQPCGL